MKNSAIKSDTATTLASIEAHTARLESVAAQDQFVGISEADICQRASEILERR